MFADWYVGTGADASRIRRQEKEREKERQKYEAAAKAKADEAQKAGLKTFAATTTEVGLMRSWCGVASSWWTCTTLELHGASQALENAFKNETIGLVTKAEFVKKRTTLQER
jgi:protein FAM50